mgnify:CR=1 FL=1
MCYEGSVLEVSLPLPPISGFIIPSFYHLVPPLAESLKSIMNYELTACLSAA